MKKNLDFYPHRVDSHRHPKFKLLRLHYGGELGWAMEARFWALNNIIAESEMCRIDLGKRRNIAVVADELSLTLAELENFLKLLISEDIELLRQIEPGIYTTKKVNEVFEMADGERQKWREKWQNKEKKETPPRESKTLRGESETLPRVDDKKKREEKKREETLLSLPDGSANASRDDDAQIFVLPSSGNQTVPNFDSEEAIKTQVISLYKTHFPEMKSLKFATHLKPILDILGNSHTLSREKIWSLIADGFLAFDQGPKEKRNTGYLLGIVKRKIERETEKAISEKNQQERRELRKNEPKGMTTAEQRDLMQECRAFFENNQDLFKDLEKYEFEKNFKDNRVLLILGKIEEKKSLLQKNVTVN